MLRGIDSPLPGKLDQLRKEACKRLLKVPLQARNLDHSVGEWIRMFEARPYSKEYFADHVAASVGGGQAASVQVACKALQ